MDYLSKFSLGGSLECHLVGAMSESMLRVFNLSVARWYALSSSSASGIANKHRFVRETVHSGLCVFFYDSQLHIPVFFIVGGFLSLLRSWFADVALLDDGRSQ